VVTQPGSLDRRAKRRQYGLLEELLADLPLGLVLLLGQPGAGKTTLLRRLERAAAADGAADAPPATLTFYVPLRRYRSQVGGLPADPWRWLAAYWARQMPAEPPLETVWATGRLTLILDGLNELPHASSREYWQVAGAWKHLLGDFGEASPANRLVVSCRSNDFRVPFDLGALPLTVVTVEPWDDERILSYLRQQDLPELGELLACLADHGLQRLARSPGRLAQLADWWRQRHGPVRLPDDLVQTWIQGALRREVLADNPLFAPGPLLSEDDLRGELHAAQHQCRRALPAGGSLLPGLARLAQHLPPSAGRTRSGAHWAWRQEALAALALPKEPADAILRAGLAMGLLEESKSGDRLAFADPAFQRFLGRLHSEKRPGDRLAAAPPGEQPAQDPTPLRTGPGSQRSGSGLN
jgi:hypothetical protein